jgi:hypothetical protein
VKLSEKYYERNIKMDEMKKAIQTGECFGKNMKHIFGSLNTYFITGEWVKLASNVKMDILVDFILDEENWAKYSSYERIREIVQELYIDLIPLEQVLKYIVRKVSEKYPKEDQMMFQMIHISTKYDMSMKMGNKITIHLETFIIHLIEILIQRFCKKTFNIK